MEIKIGYLIATYSNVIQSRIVGYKDPSKTLQIQLEQLYKILKEKKEKNIKNLISDIIIICPEKKEVRNNDYYMYDKWIDLFTSMDVDINFIDYVGDNKHHSYDQWIQGYLFNKKLDYYIVMEDDYCVDPKNIEFDIELLHHYKDKFPDDIGYLCAYACYFRSRFVAAISLGIISQKTFELFGINILDKFYNTKDFNNPQLDFSCFFTNNGIKILHIQEYYMIPFWDSDKKKIINYPVIKNDKLKSIFLPVQFCE